MKEQFEIQFDEFQESFDDFFDRMVKDIGEITYSQRYVAETLFNEKNKNGGILKIKTPIENIFVKNLEFKDEDNANKCAEIINYITGEKSVQSYKKLGSSDIYKMTSYTPEEKSVPVYQLPDDQDGSSQAA